MNKVKTYDDFTDEVMFKRNQLQTIIRNNPMMDDYHRGIRTIDDIKMFDEVLDDDEGFVYPDFTREDALESLRSGRIRVYSSRPITPGSFVTPSRMNAEDYSGGGHVYSEIVNLTDVAWLGPDEGQFTKTK